MNFDSSDNSDAHFAGKIKTQTFKQYQLERLIKEGKVIPASQLADAKEQVLIRRESFRKPLKMREDIDVLQLQHLETS